MNETETPTPTRRAFSREEKAALVLLIISGIGGLFFGFRYIGKNLQTPFAFTYSGPEYLTADEEEASKIEEMKTLDTDSDTINDYDEIYVYKTSAYLADSDSDGYNDATEIASSNDPNCPKGKECGGVASADTTVDLSESLVNGLVEPEAPDLGAAQDMLDQAGGAENMLAGMTPDQLRELLIANGADEAAVNAVSDEQLMSLYNDTLSQYQSGQ